MGHGLRLYQGSQHFFLNVVVIVGRTAIAAKAEKSSPADNLKEGLRKRSKVHVIKKG